MELSINFTCPKCREVQPVKIVELSPGKIRPCHLCGTATELTDAALSALSCQLRELLRS